MFRLLRYFSISSFIAFIIVAALLGIFFRQIAIRELIALGEDKSVALTRAFSNSIWPEFAPFLTSTAGLSARELQSHPETDRLYRVVMEQMEGLSVLKVKIYNLEGLVVFSTEGSQIGDDQSSNPGFLSALSGEVVNELYHRDAISAFESEVFDREVISSYVPIQRGGSTNPIEGVIEVYGDVTPLMHRIDRTQWNIIIGSVFILTLLYFSLFFVVRRAEANIKREYTERKQAESALARRVSELATLLEVSKAISSTLQLEDVLTLIAEHLVRAIEISGCALYRLDQESNKVETMIERRQVIPEITSSPDVTFLLNDSPSVHTVLEKRIPVSIQVSDPAVGSTEVEYLRKMGIAGLLMLPLAIGDRVIGMVELDCEREREFTNAEIQYYQTLADQASVAMENARMLSTIKRRLREQTALKEAGAVISSTLDLEVVLTHLAEKICQEVDGTSSYILSYNPETIKSTVLAEYYGPEASAKERVSDLGESYDVDEEDFENIETGLPDQYYVDDPDITEAERAHMQQYGGQTLLNIPLQVRGQTIAYVELWDSRRRRKFTPEEVALCQSIAQQAAIAIENARLFEKAQREIAERKQVEDALRRAHDELETRVQERTADLAQVVESLQEEITLRSQAEEQILHDAFHDALTGLPNRALFIDRLEHACSRSNRIDDNLFAVLLLDLDQIKFVNDSLGHTIGDQLIVATARMLERCLRPADTIARLGGDEFAILLENVEDLSNALRIANRVNTELKIPFILSGHEVFTTASIGIALSATGYDIPEDLLRDADIAMYRAKEYGRARCEVFDKDMHARAVARLKLETALRRAVELQEFQVHYQPIMSLGSSKISGFEALVRWQRANHGLVSLAEFIQLAEETALIIPIDRWVLHEACRQMRVWQEQFSILMPLSIHVNLSGKQFKQSGLIDHVTRVLQETGLDAQYLGLEITEGTFIEDIESTIFMLSQLKDLGVQLAVDDFGTGYSSLRYLHRFPIDTLKIDRSFVSGMDVDRENMEIVRTIKALASNLGLHVVAEGVETAEQLAQLKALGCEYGQGYFFFRPLDREGVEALLAEEHRLLAQSLH